MLKLYNWGVLRIDIEIISMYYPNSYVIPGTRNVLLDSAKDTAKDLEEIAHF
jgi:hypothetical protein